MLVHSTWYWRFPEEPTPKSPFLTPIHYPLYLKFISKAKSRLSLLDSLIVDVNSSRSWTSCGQAHQNPCNVGWHYPGQIWCIILHGQALSGDFGQLHRIESYLRCYIKVWLRLARLYSNVFSYMHRGRLLVRQIRIVLKNGNGLLQL